MRAGASSSLFVLLVVLSGYSEKTGPSEGVTVYKHPSFGGQGQTFGGNVFDLDGVRGPSMGFFDSSTEDDRNDCISSIRVSAP